MTSDGQHYSGYDPALIDVVLAEAAHLLRHLGFTAAHTVLIGGVVPSLLVLDPATNRAHLGTTDLDLCLSVAIVEGDTAEYERIENALRTAGYEPTDDSFRWRQSSRLRLQVEFFCPAGDDRPSGKLFRPKAADNPTAKQNFGPKLTAIALDAGHAIGEDVVVVSREVRPVRISHRAIRSAWVRPQHPAGERPRYRPVHQHDSPLGRRHRAPP